jgi:tripartite ATP-independent transporter DctP family solute receptor
MTRTAIAGLLALGLGICGRAPAASAADLLIKLAHPNRNIASDNATGAMATAFKARVESGSAGAIRVDIYPEGQLGQDDAVVALAGKGVIQSAISAVGGMARHYPLIGALDLPFAFPTIATTYAVFDGPFGQALAQDIERKTGLHVLGFGDSGGFFALTNSVRRIRTPADLAGLKIRTMGLESHKRFIRSLGGEPVGLGWSELFGALESGLVDGQMNPIPIIRFARFDEVQKYLTLTNHFFTPYVWVLNGATWRALTPERQALIAEAAHAGIVAGRALNRHIEDSDRGLPALRQRMDVYAPSAAEAAAFRQASVPAVEAYIEATFGREGRDLMNALRAAIAAAGRP